MTKTQSVQGCWCAVTRDGVLSRHRRGRAQTPAPAPHHVVAVPLQPFAVLARRVETALDYLGQPLAAADRQALAAALAQHRRSGRRHGRDRDPRSLRAGARPHQSREPRESDPGDSGAGAGAGRHAGVPRQGRQRGRHHRAASRDQPAEPAGVVALPRSPGAAADDLRARHQGALGRRLAVRQTADDRAAVRSAARVPHHRDLQSRCGPAWRRPVV